MELRKEEDVVTSEGARPDEHVVNVPVRLLLQPLEALEPQPASSESPSVPSSSLL